MFAVKGWSVDSSLLKPQTTVFASSNASNSLDTKTGKSSRKRKRQAGDAVKNDDDAVAAVISQGQIAEQNKTERIHDISKPAGEPGIKKRKKAKTKSTGDQPADQSNDQTVIEDRHQTTGDQQEDGEAPFQKVEGSKKKKKNANKQKHDTADIAHTNGSSQSQRPLTVAPKLTPMQAAMRQKLVSARFRHLNETLYTSPSQQAQDLFDSNPDMFEDYHSGFRQQVAVWPENPVDKILAKIRQRGSQRSVNHKKAAKSKSDQKAEQAGAITALPRTHGTAIIADCGCGDARLAHTLSNSNDMQRLNLKVLSYDLHSPSKLVTKADIANLPLEDGSVDVVVFCLALMGTNWISFIEEAYRVLHWKGELWIAEIKSRFTRPKRGGQVVDHSVGNRKKKAALSKSQTAARVAEEEEADDATLQTEVDGAQSQTSSETDLEAFVNVLKRRGFLLKEDANAIDHSNKMFVSLEFLKAAAPTKGKGASSDVAVVPRKRLHAGQADEISVEEEGKVLKPCLYKIR